MVVEGEAVAEVKTVQSIDVSEDNKVVVTYSDGTTANLGYVNKNSSSNVKNIAFDENNHAIVTYEDGTTLDLGALKAESKKDSSGTVGLVLSIVAIIGVCGLAGLTIVTMKKKSY